MNGTNNTITIMDIPDPTDPTNTALFWNHSCPCFDDNRFLVVGPIPFDCPSQFGFVPGEDFCTFECPYPIIDEDEYVGLWAVTGTLGVISILCCLLLLCIHCLGPELHVPHEVMALIFSAIGLSLSFALALFVGYDEMWCDDNDEPNLWGHPACTLQAMGILYFTWTSVLWWYVICLFIFIYIFIYLYIYIFIFIYLYIYIYIFIYLYIYLYNLIIYII